MKRTPLRDGGRRPRLATRAPGYHVARERFRSGGATTRAPRRVGRAPALADRPRVDRRDRLRRHAAPDARQRERGRGGGRHRSEQNAGARRAGARRAAVRRPGRVRRRRRAAARERTGQRPARAARAGGAHRVRRRAAAGRPAARRGAAGEPACPERPLARARHHDPGLRARRPVSEPGRSHGAGAALRPRRRRLRRHGVCAGAAGPVRADRGHPALAHAGHDRCDRARGDALLPLAAGARRDARFGGPGVRDRGARPGLGRGAREHHGPARDRAAARRAPARPRHRLLGVLHGRGTTAAAPGPRAARGRCARRLAGRPERARRGDDRGGLLVCAARRRPEVLPHLRSRPGGLRARGHDRRRDARTGADRDPRAAPVRPSRAAGADRRREDHRTRRPAAARRRARRALAPAHGGHARRRARRAPRGAGRGSFCGRADHRTRARLAPGRGAARPAVRRRHGVGRRAGPAARARPVVHRRASGRQSRAPGRRPGGARLRRRHHRADGRRPGGRGRRQAERGGRAAAPRDRRAPRRGGHARPGRAGGGLTGRRAATPARHTLGERGADRGRVLGRPDGGGHDQRPARPAPSDARTGTDSGPAGRDAHRLRRGDGARRGDRQRGQRGLPPHRRGDRRGDAAAADHLPARAHRPGAAARRQRTRAISPRSG